MSFPPKKKQLPALAITGPTGIGKTALSLTIARRYNCEIISVDSMQIYRYMDIGTAKPSMAEQKQVPHHLVDIVDPDTDYHAGQFVRDADTAVQQIRQAGKIPLLVGGTGLYLQRLQEGIFSLPRIDRTIRRQIQQRLHLEPAARLHGELALVDPQMAGKIHPHDRQRIGRGLEIYQATGKAWSTHLAQAQERAVLPDMLLIALTCDRDHLYSRINDRVSAMLAQGLREEVQKLLEMGYNAELKSMQAIGYRHMTGYLAGNSDYDQMVATMARDTRRYAKRQYTWFRRMNGVHWHQSDDTAGVIQAIDHYLNRQNSSS